MDNWIADLTTDILWADDVASARVAFRRYAGRVGVHTYAFAHIRGALDLSDAFLDTTYPQAWWDRYCEQRYYQFDPVVADSLTNPLPFSWRFICNRSTLTPAQRRLFSEAADFGLADGMTIPLHSGGGCSGIVSLGFATTKEMREVMVGQPNLRLLGIYYNAAIERLMEVPGTATALSAMECQCLSWSAAGRSIWDISAVLHRAESEIARALRSAREKLGTATTAQAIAKAISAGLITP